MANWGFKRCVVASAVLMCGLGTAVHAQQQWEGGFFGLQAGHSSSDLDWTLNGNGWWGSANPANNRTSFSLDGETYGVHAGYNWVLPSNVLVGVDLTYNFVEADKSKASPAFPAIDTWNADLESFWDLSARVGMAREKYMLYGALGLAMADIETTATPPVDQSSGNHAGLSIGVGGAYMVAPKTSVGLEYKYYDFGSDQHPFSGACGPCNAADGRNVDMTTHVVSLKLTKHF